MSPQVSSAVEVPLVPVPQTVMPRSLAAAVSMALFRMPVVTSSFRLGSRSSRGRGNAVRSRMATTTSKGWRRSARASSSVIVSENVVTSTGPATFDQSQKSAATERGITVCGTGILPNGTAELTWGLILATTRHIPQEDASVRAGGWQETVGTDLAGARLGVVGLGGQGSQVARIGLAFGMDVVAWSQNLTDERAAEVGVRRVERDELFATSDVVTIHLLLSKRTRGLIAADDLALMKHTAVLINTSRGPIVEQQALLDAQHDGSIGGAGLDVFHVEPLPAGHALRTAPRTVLTPHLGYVTRNTYEVFYRDAVEDVAAFLAGAPVRVLE